MDFAGKLTGCEIIHSGFCVDRIYKGERMIFAGPVDTNYFETRNVPTTMGYEPNIVSFHIPSAGTYMSSISYSTDAGQTWTTTQIPRYRTDIVINVELGQSQNIQDNTIWWKGTGQGTADWNSGDARFCYFSSTNKTTIRGNIMSLLWGDNDFTSFSHFWAETDGYNYPYVGTFAKLFYHWENLISAPIYLPPAIQQVCYYSMFEGCTNLNIAPVLRSLRCANGCYARMFKDCTYLQKTPELPALLHNTNGTPTEGAYESMFEGCTNLTTISYLYPAPAVFTKSYKRMFYGCTRLATIPSQIGSADFDNWFTMVGESACESMFEGCTSLTKAPELPCTRISRFCYKRMFANCPNIIGGLNTNPIVFPAETLYHGCYEQMFYGNDKIEGISVRAAKEYSGATGTIASYQMLSGNTQTGIMFADIEHYQWPEVKDGYRTPPSQWLIMF